MTKEPAAAGRRIPAWLRRTLRVLGGVVSVLCVAMLALAGTGRETVLNTAYYAAVLDHEHAYQRMYDEVLVDPATADVTRDLLARLPVPRSKVLANLKIVLPPTTLRTLVEEQIAHIVAYLRGDTPTLALSVDLRPVLANVGVLAEVYLGELVASVQHRAAPDFPAFLTEVRGALGELAAGQPPTGIPSVRLTVPDQARALRVLLEVVPASARPSVRPLVEAALGTGDIASALAAVGPYVLSVQTGAARHDLTVRVGNGEWEVLPDLKKAGLHIGAVQAARSFTLVAVATVQALAVLGLGTLAFLWFTGPPQTYRRLRSVGWTLVAGGSLALAVVAVARWRIADLLPNLPAVWPPSLRSLVGDLQHHGANVLFTTGLLAVLPPLTGGLLLAGGAWLWHRRASDRRLGTGMRLALVGAVVLAPLSVIGGTITPSLSAPGPPRCLGSTEPCSLRYDQAAYLATHNSMSTTAARFIGPDQDPDIISQLDEGARALLIDTHTWESVANIATKLAHADLPPDLKAELPTLINRVDPPKPGLWLCHAVCRAGATPLVATLERLAVWLDTNPGEVVTLVIQNGITAEQTAQAFAASGLDRLIYTPAADPSAQWPTLGEMVRTDKRLVVFAESADGPAPWYRNFYLYGMETPFDASSATNLSCAPNRGAEGKRLFLLNEFVTVSGGSRLAAGEVNAKQFVLDRVHRCQTERHALVNFVAVDYATIGDALGAVNALNAERVAH